MRTRASQSVIKAHRLLLLPLLQQALVQKTIEAANNIIAQRLAKEPFFARHTRSTVFSTASLEIILQECSMDEPLLSLNHKPVSELTEEEFLSLAMEEQSSLSQSYSTGLLHRTIKPL